MTRRSLPSPILPSFRTALCVASHDFASTGRPESDCPQRLLEQAIQISPCVPRGTGSKWRPTLLSLVATSVFRTFAHVVPAIHTRSRPEQPFEPNAAEEMGSLSPQRRRMRLCKHSALRSTETLQPQKGLSTTHGPC